MSSLLLGFGIGLTLIIAIGAQNAFVLRCGIARRHVTVVVLVCAASDAVLILAGVLGVGAVVQRFPTAITVVTLAGAAFLGVYGALALNRARRPAALSITDSIGPASRAAAILTALALTWLNPHVYLDTLVFLGSVANRESGSGRWLFAAGAVCASIVWFAGLGYGARLATPFFARASSWRILDVVIGVVMLSIAVGLLVGL